MSGGPAFLPVNPLQTHYQLDSAWNLTVNKHTLKFGWHGIRRHMKPFVNEAVRGNITFDRAYTQDPTNPSTTGFGPASALTGFFVSGNRSGIFEPYYLYT